MLHAKNFFKSSIDFYLVYSIETNSKLNFAKLAKILGKSCNLKTAFEQIVR